MKLIYIDKNIIGTVTKYCHLFLMKKGKLTVYNDVEEGISYYTSPNYNTN